MIISNRHTAHRREIKRNIVEREEEGEKRVWRVKYGIAKTREQTRGRRI